jgi:hypothetical protein
MRVLAVGATGATGRQLVPQPLDAAKAKAELGWQPMWPTWRERFLHGVDRAYPDGRG